MRCSGKNDLKLVVLGVIELKKYEDHYLKLKAIYDRVQQLADQYLPDEVAIEAPFYGKNVQSMLKLGRAQGLPWLLFFHAQFQFCVRTAENKAAITGREALSKGRWRLCWKPILGKGLPQEYLDATDGLAAAVCHFFQGATVGASRKASSWSDFVRQNPGRVK